VAAIVPDNRLAFSPSVAIAAIVPDNRLAFPPSMVVDDGTCVVLQRLPHEDSLLAASTA
jgi:hypothetical protein